jgi:hypothetical protein
MVQVTVGGGGDLQGAEADAVKGLVVEGETLVGILDKLVDREGGVVWLHDSVRHLGGGNDRVSGHDAIRVLFTDLGDQQSSHSRTSTRPDAPKESRAAFADLEQSCCEGWGDQRKEPQPPCW